MRAPGRVSVRQPVRAEGAPPATWCSVDSALKFERCIERAACTSRTKNLKEIATDAARSLFPAEHIGDVSGSVGVAFNGEEAYQFIVHLDQMGDREEAADLRIDLRVAIRDRLLAKGDERYPYTRILSRDAVV